MKRNKLFGVFVLFLGLGVVALMSSCKGDDGAAGARGPAGVDGTNGTDGTPGTNGDAVCMECHNVTKKAEITAEWVTSTHGLGEVAHSRGGSKGCGMCHSDQGFRETQYTGQDTLADAIGLPQAIQCGTCHDFHQSLDFTNERNYALRTIAAVDLLMYRADDPLADPVTMDLGTGSNLCANCHQPRRVGPVSTDDSTRVTSSHYGPHHGPQSTSLAGLGAYEVGSGYPAPGTGSKHATDATCTACHMHSGEHTWKPGIDGCNTTDCHNGNLTTVFENQRQKDFAAKMVTLEGKLKTAGLLDVDGHPAVGTYPTDQVGALYNYEWLVDDRSNGVHNFPYLETMLDNSIAVLP